MAPPPLSAICITAASLLTLSLIALDVRKPSDLSGLAPAPGIATSPIPSRAPNFVEQAYEVGLHAYHSQQSKGITGLDESLGSGVCVVDFNNDRSMDVFVVGGSGHTHFYRRASWWAQKQSSKLYRNEGDGYFTDVSDLLNLEDNIAGMGCATADLNGNGWPDLVLSTRHSVELLINEEGRRFRSQQLWQDRSGWPTSIAIADINNNGLPDIYIANYLDYSNTAKHFEASGGYKQGLQVQFSPQYYRGRRNLLFINYGDLVFHEEAADRNITVSDGRTLSAHWIDANSNNQLDLLVVNDAGSASQLFLNRNGHFEKAQGRQNIDIPSQARSASIDDLDNDGDLDIVMATTLGDTAVVLKRSENGFNNEAWQTLTDPGSSLHHSTYGIAKADLNNNGNLDVYFANGFTAPDADSHYQPQGQPNAIALGNDHGKLDFIDLGAIDGSLSSRSVIVVDIDNDGDDDLLITNNNGPLQLFVNRAPVEQWLGVDAHRLRKAELTTDQRKLVRFTKKETFLGSHDPRLRFLLRADERAQSLRLYWLDGTVNDIKNPTTNRYMAFTKQQATDSYGPTATAPPPPRDFRLIEWSIIAKEASQRDIPAFNTLSPEQKIRWLQLITDHQTNEHLGVIKRALNDSNAKVIESAIFALKKLEREDTAHWLINLFSSKQNFDRCVLSEAYRHFFIEEEIFIQSKHLAIPLLIKQLETEDDATLICTLAALSKSRSPRPVLPIRKLLEKNAQPGVHKMALYTLGELRRSNSFVEINFDPSFDHAVYAEYVLAQNKATGQLDHSGASRYTRLYSQRQSKNDNSTTSTPNDQCVSTPVQNLARLRPTQIAGVFNLCNADEIRLWSTINETWLRRNYSIFFDNDHLNPSVLDGLLSTLAISPPEGFTDLLHTRLINAQSSRQKLAILKHLAALDAKGLDRSLKAIFTSADETKKVRIIAGDILIHSDSAFVMQHARDIFND